MEKIEDKDNPQIGDFYLVRTVKFLRRGIVLNWPVIDKIHKDMREYDLNENLHYHIDWRFMAESILLEHRVHNQSLWEGWKDYRNAEYLSPILGSEKISEEYVPWKYLRDFGKPPEPSINLQYKFKTIKMKNFKCPHHGTNLKSCRSKDGVIQCPQHGLKWNIETKELVL